MRLRPPEPGDVDAFYSWAADPRMMEHMGRGPWTRAEVEEGMERWLAHWREHGFGVWIAEDREGGEAVGRCGLSFHRAWPNDPEAGWWIAPEWQGRGLATEAGRASVAYAFDTLGVDRVVSICIEENLASRRVMAKLGFEKLTEVVSPRWPELVLWIHALSR
ncbi:MAG: GNAT family N-acetyltransferase [Gaiellaceae bacterium]